MSAVWPTMHAADLAPAPSTISGARQSTRKPGIDSSLSSVPPVWPRPRPDIIGTTTPQAAASGASTSDVLSPTPPVVCLSTLRPGKSPRGRGGRPTRPSPRSARPSPRRPCRAGRWPSAAPRSGSRASDPSVAPATKNVDLGAVEGPAVALFPDDVDGTHGRQKYSSPCRKSRRHLPILRREPRAVTGSTSAYEEPPGR